MKLSDWLILGIIALITIALVFVADHFDKKTEERESVGRDLCSVLNLTFGEYQSYHQHRVVCKLVVKSESEHLNISSQEMDIYLYPDWGYYLNKTGKR